MIINIHLNIAAKQLVGNTGKYAGRNIIHSYNKVKEVESFDLILMATAYFSCCS
jgi:hypothetical protein